MARSTSTESCFDFITAGKSGYKVLLVLTDLREPRPGPNPAGDGAHFCSSFSCHQSGKDGCNCGDFTSHDQAEQFHNCCDPQDTNRLDGDNDGLACE